jgi:DNA-binding CsgD family transcriptional regulator
MNRSFSPAPYFTDRLKSAPVILVLFLMTTNIVLQITAELSGSTRATLAAGWGIMAYLVILASIVVMSAARLYRPGTVSSARRGVFLVKSLPVVPMVLIPLSTVLPGAWPEALGPMALLALLVMVLIIFIRQTGDTGNSDQVRQALFDESGLTAREREIALMLAEGLSYKEISTTLFVSLSTIQTHVARIYGKMGVNSKTELSRKVGGK